MNTNITEQPPYYCVGNTLKIMFNNKMFTKELTDHLKTLINNEEWDAIYRTVSPNILDIDTDRTLPDVVVRKVEYLKEQGLPTAAYRQFIVNLLTHTDIGKLEEIAQFLEAHPEFVITGDGAFLAYKKVDEHYQAYHNSSFVYKPGTEVVENDVDLDRTAVCSRGLHFCAASYLPHFYGTFGRVVILKVFPQDVVAIPTDYAFAKGRASKVFVIGDADDEVTKMAFQTGFYGTYECDEEEDCNEDGWCNDLLDDDTSQSHVFLDDLDPLCVKIINKLLSSCTPLTIRSFAQSYKKTNADILASLQSVAEYIIIDRTGAVSNWTVEFSELGYETF